MKTLYVKQWDKSKTIFIVLWFLLILFISLTVDFLSNSGKIPTEMYWIIWIVWTIILYVFFYAKKWKTDTFLWRKDNAVVLWDILKFSISAPFIFVFSKFSNKNTNSKKKENKKENIDKSKKEINLEIKEEKIILPTK